MDSYHRLYKNSGRSHHDTICLWTPILKHQAGHVRPSTFWIFEARQLYLAMRVELTLTLAASLVSTVHYSPLLTVIMLMCAKANLR